jgi:hypothetical protein
MARMVMAVMLGAALAGAAYPQVTTVAWEVDLVPAPVRDVGTPVVLPELLGRDLSAHLRDALVKNLPKDLVYETSANWGHQARVPSIQGVRPIYVLRNHGNWEKSRVVARDVPDRVRVRFGHFTSLADDRVAITLHLTTPARIELRKEIWQNGLEVYASRVEARFQFAADVEIEAFLQPIPGAKESKTVAGYQIMRGAYRCRNFVAENVNGIGGDLGRLGAGALEHSFIPWQPIVLGEFQKSIVGIMQASAESPVVRKDVNQLVVEAAVARRIALEAAPTVTAAASLPDSLLLPLPPTPIASAVGPFLSLSLELPLRVHVQQAPAPTERYPHYDHPGLANHSAHYDHSKWSSHSTSTSHSTSSSSSSSHTTPSRKK